MFTTHISRQGKCSLTDKRLRIVVVLNLDAIVRVIANAARRVQRVRAQHILIPENRQPTVRTPEELHTESRPVIEPAVGLPAVYKPRLDLQMLRRENLYSNAVEKPWSIRRNVRGLIGPVVELVV